MMRAAFVLLAVLAACDGGRAVTPGTPGPGRDASVGGLDATIATGPHAARCTTACVNPPDGPCASAGTGTCPTDCTTRLEGLSATCAACVTEHSGWEGERCSCIGAGCHTCPFGPGGRTCSGAQPSDMCAPSDESCEGFEQAKITSTECASACVGSDAGVPAMPSYAARCAILCRRPANGPCASADEAACLSACRGLVDGLPAACGLCLIDESGYAGTRCSCIGAGCNTCSFGPGGRPCVSSQPSDMCATTDERCDGLEVVSTTSGRCAQHCQ